MSTRIYFMVVDRATMLLIATIILTSFTTETLAQGDSGYLTDPVTGLVYRKVIKTIETPVYETQVTASEQTVYRPQTVVETRPHTRTVLSPMVEYKWEPRVHGRWNPFQQPSIGYQHVPHTTWHARNETVHHTNTRTEWVAERRTVEVPSRIVKMHREQKVEYEPVGRVPQSQLGPPAANDALAARLRPLDSGSTIEPLVSSPGYPTVPAVPGSVASTYGTPARSSSQGGMRPTDLAPTAPAGLMSIPTTTSGVATATPLPMFR